MDEIWNFRANSWLSSMLILPTVALPAVSDATCSMVGISILHGAHHSAQKSIKTTPLAVKLSKLEASMDCSSDMVVSVILGG